VPFSPPWLEEVCHRWLEKLLTGRSAKEAYLAASLWPAHDLTAKVTYTSSPESCPRQIVQACSSRR